MNEKYKRLPKFEKDISVHGVMVDIKKTNPYDIWSRKSLERACAASDKIMDEYFSINGDAMGVLVRVGTSRLQLEHEEGDFKPFCYDDEDKTLWGEVDRFEVVKLDDDTSDNVDTLCARIRLCDERENIFLVPLAQAGKKGVLVELTGAPFVTLEDVDIAVMPVAEQSIDEAAFRDQYHDIVSQTIFATGLQKSQCLHEMVSILYDEDAIYDLDEFSSIMNIYFAEERREGGAYQVDFNGHVEVLSADGGVRAEMMQDAILELGVVEFVADETAPGCVRAYAYMVDEDDRVVRSDMSENNFIIERSSADEVEEDD